MNRSCLIPAAVVLAASAIHPAFAQHKPSTCSHCGVVESVQAVQRTEKPKGIAGTPVTPGMAIGGVVGGVVGNKIGDTPGTVLGAAGGAYAGHKIEEKQKQYTAYVMRVRMNDGSIRTVEQRTALAKGSHVVVDGKTAHLQQPAKPQG